MNDLKQDFGLAYFDFGMFVDIKHIICLCVRVCICAPVFPVCLYVVCVLIVCMSVYLLNLFVFVLYVCT